MAAGVLFGRGDAIAQDTPAPPMPEAPPGAPQQPVPAPESPAPEAPAPEGPAPESPAPEAPAPEATAPEAPAPEATAPEAPAAPTEPKPEKVEEITVTARRREESVQNVPLSVTPFSKAQLERGYVRDLTDLQSLAPNVIIAPVPISPGGAGLAIRGIQFNDTEKTFDPAVGVFIDGVYIGTNSTQLLNNFDLEEIEILRGPQGTLFGRNTTAGIINVRRTRPTGKYGVKGSVIAGSFGRHDYKLVANAPIVEEKLAVKASGYSLNANGPYYNTYTREHAPNQGYLSGALDLLYTPTKSLDIWAKYERIYDRSTSLPFKNASDSTHIACFGPPLGLTTFSEPQCAGGRKLDVESDFRNNADLDLDAVTLTIEKRFGDKYKVISIAGWRGHDEDYSQDFDGSKEDYFSTRRTQRYDQVSEELRFHAEPTKNLSLVTGLYYFYAHYDLNATVFYLFDQPFLQQVIMASLPMGTVRIQDAGQTTNSIAGFAHAELEIIKNLRATAGARYTFEQKDFRNDWGLSNTLDPDAALFFTNTDAEKRVEGEKSWSELTPAGGLDYKIDRLFGEGNGALIYGNYARGFKSGGFNGRADPATNATYNPETVDQFELGVKTDWAKRRLTFNTAAFWTNYQNKQEEVLLASTTGGQQTLTQNAASAVIRGLEFESSATPLRGRNALVGGLRLWGNLGLLDAQYRRFYADLNGPDADGTIRKVDNSSMELKNAPAWQFGVGVSNPYELSFGRFSIDAQYRRRASMRGSPTFARNAAGQATDTPDNRGILPALGQFDASLSLEADDFLSGGWRATVFGRNIFSERPRVAYIDVPGLFAFQSYAPGAQWGAEIAAKY